MLKIKTWVAALGLSVLAASAMSAEITGAGATFPFPIYAKWAEAYKAKTGNSMNYQSIGSSGGIKQIKAKTVVLIVVAISNTTQYLATSPIRRFP